MRIARAQELQDCIRQTASQLNQLMAAAHREGLSITIDIHETQSVDDQYALPRIATHVLASPKILEP